MRQFLLSLLLAVFMAQPALAEPTKILLHISDKRNAQVVQQALANIVQHYGEGDREIVLIANGPAVELFSKQLGKEALMQNLTMNDVEVGVCNIALRRFDVPEDQLYEGVKIFPESGIIRILELQKQGYLYVKI
jgi:intracellular sulfur oxidation DsrE/DsrF family protein